MQLVIMIYKDKHNLLYYFLITKETIITKT